MLLTVEEARRCLVRSALVCLRQARCPTDDLRRLLAGHPALRPLDRPHRRMAQSHRRALDIIGRAGYGWIIDDQLDGIYSAVGLNDGLIAGLDVSPTNSPTTTATTRSVLATGQERCRPAATPQRQRDRGLPVAVSTPPERLRSVTSDSAGIFAPQRIPGGSAAAPFPAVTRSAATGTRIGGMAATFEIRDTGNGFRWVLLRQGRVLATSEAYSRKASCLKAIEAFRTAAATAALAGTGDPRAANAGPGATIAGRAAPTTKTHGASRVAAAAVETPAGDRRRRPTGTTVQHRSAPHLKPRRAGGSLPEEKMTSRVPAEQDRVPGDGSAGWRERFSVLVLAPFGRGEGRPRRAPERHLEGKPDPRPEPPPRTVQADFWGRQGPAGATDRRRFGRSGRRASVITERPASRSRSPRATLVLRFLHSLAFITPEFIPASAGQDCRGEALPAGNGSPCDPWRPWDHSLRMPEGRRDAALGCDTGAGISPGSWPSSLPGPNHVDSLHAADALRDLRPDR